MIGDNRGESIALMRRCAGKDMLSLFLVCLELLFLSLLRLRVVKASFFGTVPKVPWLNVLEAKREKEVISRVNIASNVKKSCSSEKETKAGGRG